MPNRLQSETSPYLLQHKDNPVDWYPWGDEAFSAARELDRPILLSVGYSSCHWCHVMEHESFSNQETAQLMNSIFINVKVDREERPDVDSIYMSAVQTMTGQGGWPMTVVLTPEGRPFFAGTYFPPVDRAGMPGFRRLISIIAEAYQNRRDEVEQTALDIEKLIKERLERGRLEDTELNVGSLKQADTAILAEWDMKEGSLRGSPKFIQPTILEYLLTRWYRDGRDDLLQAATLTLRKAACGAINDQLGGGFARYATDSLWRVPHFEKMLYDNAQLAKLYCQVWQINAEPLFRSVTKTTIDYVLRELSCRDAVFYSAQDADSEGVEGKYYAWGYDEFRDIAGKKDSALACSYWDVTPEGNFDSANTLYIDKSIEQLASEFRMSQSDVQDTLHGVRRKLLKERSKRVPPQTDDKIIVAWNALMIDTLSYCGRVFNSTAWVNRAITAAQFILEKMVDPKTGRLARIWSERSEKASVNGFLTDYALLINSLLSVYQSQFNGHFLRIAKTLSDCMIELFWDATEERFYDSAETSSERVLTIPRSRDVFDNVMPSGGAAAISSLVRLNSYVNSMDYQTIIQKGFNSVAHYIIEAPLSVSSWLTALDLELNGMEQLVISMDSDQHDVSKIDLFLAIARRGFAPDRVTGLTDRVREDNLEWNLFETKPMLNNEPTAYLCRNFSCQTPTSDPKELERILNS